jgi:hypothetical protein
MSKIAIKQRLQPCLAFPLRTYSCHLIWPGITLIDIPKLPILMAET